MAQIATWKTWPRCIQNDEDYRLIPPDLRSAYEADVGQGYRPGVYLVHCPFDARQSRKHAEKLLYVFDSSLIFIERRQNRLARRQFRAEHVGVIESGHMLLNAWMTIAVCDGKSDDMAKIYYNRISHPFFERIVEMMRTMALGVENPVRYDNSAASSLQEINYKYNCARDLVFEDEGPAKYVFQRALADKRFGMFRINLINDHVLMHTQKELIQITEGKSRTDHYETTKTFYVRKYLNQPDYSEASEAGRVRLTLSSGAYSRSVWFGEENMQEVKGLVR